MLIVGLIIFVSYIFSLGSSEQADYGQILTMLEEENEQVVEDAFQALEDGGLNLDQIPIITEDTLTLN